MKGLWAAQDVMKTCKTHEECAPNDVVNEGGAWKDMYGLSAKCI